MNPIDQLNRSILFLQSSSVFNKSYKNNSAKSTLWENYYEDVMNIFAKLPRIAGLIYCNVAKKKPFNLKKNYDYLETFAETITKNNEKFVNFLCLFNLLYCDDTASDTFSRVIQMTGSTWADPFLALSSGLSTLGGKSEMVNTIEFISQIEKNVGINSNFNEIMEKLHPLLVNDKLEVHGFKNQFFTIKDPKYTILESYAKKTYNHLVKFRFINNLEMALTRYHKIGNWKYHIRVTPDFLAGFILQIHKVDPVFFQLITALSKSIGSLSNLLINRAYNLPMEQQDSVNHRQFRKIARYNNGKEINNETNNLEEKLMKKIILRKKKMRKLRKSLKKNNEENKKLVKV